MNTLSLKAAALGAASIIAIAAPVAANHNAPSLRGMFSAEQAPIQNMCDPCGWQQRILQSRLRSQAQPTYVTQDTTQLGLRGYSSAGDVRIAQRAPAQISLYGHNDYAAAQAAQYEKLSSINYHALDYAPTISPHYDPAAQAAFFSDRNINVGGVSVRTAVQNSARMLDFQENTTGKALNLLANRQSGVLAPNSLYIGGGFKGGFMYQKTDVDGQFPLLSRFPFFSANTDDEAGVFAINNAALSFTSTFGDWTTVYLQPEYSETEYGRSQDEFQLRKAYVVFGNLDRSPIYAAFGRKTIDFGNFDSYNAFTHNEGAHYFWAVSDQPVAELGFYKNGWKLVASALSGGRQLRVAFADEENNIGNYAFSAEKEFLLDGIGIRGGAFTVGGGYLHDTIYRDNFTAHTFGDRQTQTPPANLIEYRNSAVNAFAEYNSPFFDAMVEYTTTLRPWAAAIPQSPDGTPLPQFLNDPAGSTTDIDNINFNENLSVIVAQARIKPVVAGRRMAIAASGSWGNISNDFGNPLTGTTFEKNQQHALSVEYPINPYLDIGAEYVYNKGFIPFVAPQLVSNDETEAHAINVGFKARF